MGHYDECRPGYCASCGAAPGNIKNGKCEFCGTQCASKEFTKAKVATDRVGPIVQGRRGKKLLRPSASSLKPIKLQQHHAGGSWSDEKTGAPCVGLDLGRELLTRAKKDGTGLWAHLEAFQALMFEGDVSALEIEKALRDLRAHARTDTDEIRRILLGLPGCSFLASTLSGAELVELFMRRLVVRTSAGHNSIDVGLVLSVPEPWTISPEQASVNAEKEAARLNKVHAKAEAALRKAKKDLETFNKKANKK